MGDNYMPKYDPVKDAKNVKPTDIILMKRLEEFNKKRAEKTVKLRRGSRVMGISLGCLALGIYLYTIHAVRQETFLNDFEEPDEKFTNK